jgi:hypothetical protein
MDKGNLLNKFNKTESTTIISKESVKNSTEEDAQTKLNVDNLNNRGVIGKFAVSWVIWTIKITSVLLLIMVCAYLYKLLLDPVKLEYFLKFIYNESIGFIEDHQAILAAIATLMFGDKLKEKVKNNPT